MVMKAKEPLKTAYYHGNSNWKTPQNALDTSGTSIKIASKKTLSKIFSQYNFH